MPFLKRGKSWKMTAVFLSLRRNSPQLHVQWHHSKEVVSEFLERPQSSLPNNRHSLADIIYPETIRINHIIPLSLFTSLLQEASGLPGHPPPPLLQFPSALNFLARNSCNTLFIQCLIPSGALLLQTANLQHYKPSKHFRVTKQN